MRRIGLVMLTIMILMLMANVVPAAAQDAQPTSEVVYDPRCALNLMQAYMSGWEYNHRDKGVLDTVEAAQVARAVYAAFQPLKIDCQNATGYFKQKLLRSMRGDYSPDDLARMLNYVQEVVGAVDRDDCAFSTADQFLGRVDWGEATALQIGRTIGDIYRDVREVIAEGACDGTYKLVANLLSQLDDIPSDGTLINTLYQTLSAASSGRSISEYECGYQLANSFFNSVNWDGLTSTQITALISDTFKITYGISGDRSCEASPDLAITAMLLDDVYQFAPDASIIQQTFDAASGNLVIVTPAATVTP